MTIPKWDAWNSEYYINIPVGRQTLHMAFQLDPNEDSRYLFNVYLNIYTKRKHADKNYNTSKVTGESPFETFSAARRAFNQLELITVEDFLSLEKPVVIYCHWIDNRRRDAYYKVLSKKGYKWNMINGHRAISKTFYSVDDIK